MKINDLFETQQDEGIGSALGKVAGAVGKGVGAVAGGARALGTAAKAGYKAGSQGAQQSILGQVLPDVNFGGKQQPQAGQQAPASGQQGTSPQANATPSNVQQATEPVQSNASQVNTQQAAAEPPKATAMKGNEIAGELKGVWDKASADQGSMTGSPQVQQQIIAMAKAAGLAGRKIEGKQFYSKFLGKDI